jgi:hypothetical protein
VQKVLDLYLLQEHEFFWKYQNPEFCMDHSCAFLAQIICLKIHIFR